jgi:hypothetical protein
VRGFLPSTREASMSGERFKLTDEEAITLRRVAFGESEVRSLRRADIARLLELRLIADGRDGLALTTSGRELFESLPRALFAGRPR